LHNDTDIMAYVGRGMLIGGIVVMASVALGAVRARAHQAHGTYGASVAGPSQGPERLAAVDGLSAPEALTFDPVRDAYFVSNVNGSPGVKDGNGFISRITADGKLDSLHFIQGGRAGVTLNAPMGSRTRGDTLWVLDVDALRAFDTRSGAPLTTVDLAPAGALFLNDLAFGPTGEIYVSDMRLRVSRGGNMTPTGPGRIYRIGPDRKVSVALESARLSSPDGLGWDPAGRRLIIAPFEGPNVLAWRPGESVPRTVAQGKGRFDGVEVEPDGSILISAWNDSSVATLEGGKLVRRLGPLRMTPADVSMDTRRGRVGIVSLEVNRFELWSWPKQGASTQ
jgi:sugar lactone lactonase YvrE